METARRKRLYNAFDPRRSLPPDDPFNVDIDRREPQARGYPWATRLADMVVLPEAPAQVFFSGLRGSGKSTELKRMAARLERPEQGGYRVAFIDANDSIDLLNPIDVPDLLAALVHGAEQRVLEAESRDPEEALQEGFLARTWAWLTRTDTELTKAEYTIPAGPKLVAEMRTRPTLRQRLRRVLNAHLNRFIEDVRQELAALDKRAQDAGSPGELAVVFDTLEKLRGTSETYEEVLASAERVFVRDAPWFDLPVPVVWTVPPPLVTRARLEVSFLPMVKLWDRQADERFEGGYRVLRELVGRRASDPDLEALLGPDFEAVLERLITDTGGFARDLLGTLRELVLAAPADAEAVERAVATKHDEVNRIVPTGAYPWLARVAGTHSIATRDDDEKALADRLIDNNVVLRYQNRSPWFDVHPALRALPQVASPAGGEDEP